MCPVYLNQALFFDQQIHFRPLLRPIHLEVSDLLSPTKIQTQRKKIDESPRILLIAKMTRFGSFKELIRSVNYMSESKIEFKFTSSRHFDFNAIII